MPASDSRMKRLMVMKGLSYFGLVLSIAGSINASLLSLKIALRIRSHTNIVEDSSSISPATSTVETPDISPEPNEIGVGWQTDLLYSIFCLFMNFICLLFTVTILVSYKESIPVLGLVISSIFFATYPILRAIWDTVMQR
jgi:hypothetical protein